LKKDSIIYLIILYFILVSCGQVKEQTKLKISLAAVTGSAKFPGGLLFAGKNIETNEKFSRIISANDNLTLELTNGKWNFYTVGWDGGAIFEGNSLCDQKLNINLNGGEIPLDMNLTQLKCASPAFGNHLTSLNFSPLEFNSCSGIKKYIQNSPEIIPVDLDCASDESVIIGSDTGYKISILGAENNGPNGEILTSTCQTLSSGKVLSPLKIPFGVANNNGAGVNIRIDAYEGGGCTTFKRSHLLKNLLANSAEGFTAIAKPDDTNNKIRIFIHTDLCNPAQAANSPFGNGSPGASVPRLICNESHWASVDSDLGFSSERNYILGNDVIFSAGNTTINNTLKGSIEGNGFSFINGDNPLLELIATSSSSSDIRISDFKIKNFDINMPGGSGAMNVGILANNILSSNNANRIEIEDIEVDADSSIIISNSTTWTGYIGGLIGYINFNVPAPAYNEYVFIRNNKSFADINISTTSGSTGSLGGLIGYAHGPTTIDNNGIAFEFNQVGFKDDDFTSYKVNLASTIPSGDTRVGGLIGKAKAIEVRSGNIASSSVTGNSRVGGLIGDSFEYVSIENSVADIEFIPSISPTNNIGGLVGSISQDDVTVIGSLAHLKVNSSNTVNSAGGLVGEVIGRANSSSLQIRNSKARIDFDAPGQYIGGLIGQFASLSITGDTIIGAVAEGVIKDTTISTSSLRRGGVVGQATNFQGKNLIADIDIKGEKIIGGLFGWVDGVDINTVFTNSSVEAYTNASSPEVGGIVGNINGTNASTFSNIKLIGQVSASGLDCLDGTNYCGAYAGINNRTDASMFSDIISLQSLNDNAGGFTENCMPAANCTISQFPAISNLTSDSSCSGLGSEFLIDGGACELSFEVDWRKFAYKYDSDLGRSVYLSGGDIEPYDLASVSDWNYISDKPHLMEKSFKLLSNLDFSGGITQIGSISYPFKGRIIPNNKMMSNINITADSTTKGIFGVINHAKIGFWHDPLKINFIDIDTNSQNGVGIIGESQGGQVSVIAKNVNIYTSGSSNYVGLIGNVSDHTRIEKSGIDGKIVLGGLSAYIGGLVGDVAAGKSLNIENSYAKLEKLEGDNFMGGLVGSMNTGSNVKIEKSYVWFDKFNQNSGDDIVLNSATSILAGFVGSDGSASVYLDNCYIDISNTQFNAFANAKFKHFVEGAGATTSNKIGRIGPFKSDGQEGATPSYTSHKLLADGESFKYGDDHDDWWIDATGNLKLAWENPNYIWNDN